MEKYDIRLSKSRVMMYDYCQYKYKRVYRDGCSQPETFTTLKGTQYHTVREKCIEKIDVQKITDNFNENYEYFRSLLPKEKDPILDVIAKLEAESATKKEPELFKPISVEQDYYTVYCDPKYFDDYNEYTEDIKQILTEDQITSLNLEYGIDPIIYLKGRPDSIYLLDDGTYSVYEFKTGTWNSNTATKIRKELIYYTFLLKPHLDAEINHISYCYTSIDKTVTEKIQNRSIKAFKGLIYRIIVSNLTSDFNQKFFYKSCKNCFLCEECELTSRRSYV